MPQNQPHKIGVALVVAAVVNVVLTGGLIIVEAGGVGPVADLGQFVQSVLRNGLAFQGSIEADAVGPGDGEIGRASCRERV